MNFSNDVGEQPTASSVPDASRLCDFGIVELLRSGPGVWHWRCLAMHAPTWSKVTFTTMMDAYQGAAFAAHHQH